MRPKPGRGKRATHVRKHAAEAGYPALSKAAKATVQRILVEQPLHPEKIKYYLERRDPDFEVKRRVRLASTPGLSGAFDTAGEFGSVAQARVGPLSGDGHDTIEHCFAGQLCAVPARLELSCHYIPSRSVPFRKTLLVWLVPLFRAVTPVFAYATS